MDETTLDSGSWIGQNIIVDLDALSLTIGSYTFVNIYDSSGNHAIDAVIVPVTEASFSSFSSSTSNSEISSASTSTTSPIPASTLKNSSSLETSKSTGCDSSPWFEFMFVLMMFISIITIRKFRKKKKYPKMVKK